MTQVFVKRNLAASLSAACVEVGLTPTSFLGQIDGTTLLEWKPDLSATDQATVAALVKLAVGATLVTTAERDSLEPFLATGRLFQQQAQADFIALTQNARDRMLFDNVTALWRVIRMFRRD